MDTTRDAFELLLIMSLPIWPRRDCGHPMRWSGGRADEVRNIRAADLYHDSFVNGFDAACHIASQDSQFTVSINGMELIPNGN